ncbi:hypothetical protein JWG42_05155 [Desulfoprunum benzoelyticum]|uniref:Uncharacterized protein n=1 Tax=Desulfoprunum benzoelyticum TaxID=1506996 RepID=A0A840UPU6_9BACT|nr:hypothetical protein [Desulfoprunum benzoelyticum]MBB5348267.1 hypothetical protein [Desulfoprunum benzoelyticum]MBM9529540.1 hypothetical protein [Desulfoprunum benzoelyticum]
MANRNRKEKELPIYMESAEKFSKDDDSIENSIQFIIRKQQAWNDRHRALIDDAEVEYRKDGNPMHAWDIFMLCRRDKWPIPEWVMRYLDQTADRLTATDAGPDELGECLGFKAKKTPCRGGRQGMSQYRLAVIRREAIAHIVNWLREHPLETIEEACQYAYDKINSRWGFVSKDPILTLKKWYNTHK